MVRALFFALFLFAMPAWSQGRVHAGMTHLGVPANHLVMVDLSTRTDLTTGQMTTTVGMYQKGTWTWINGAKGFEVPKGRTFIVTDAQAWVLHEPGTGTPASLELILEHPSAGYSGSMALFTFADIPANAMGVKRQTWTSGFAVPEGMSVKLWAQQFYPLSLMSMGRIVLHGYYL